MTSSPLGEMLPRAETIAWPRVPAWSAGAVAARRALKSFAIVRAHRTEGRRERSAEPAPERARVFVGARGHSAFTVTVHIGPLGGTVDLRAAAVGHVLSMAPNETRSVEFDVVPQADWVPISIRASRAFRPADVDPQSGDQRLLGCQVRVTLR